MNLLNTFRRSLLRYQTRKKWSHLFKMIEFRIILIISVLYLLLNQLDFSTLHKEVVTRYKLSSVFLDYLWNKPQHFRRKTEVVKDERDVSGHSIIVTGSNRGIGKQIALELAKRGAHVIMACRNLKRAEWAKEEILKQVPNGKLETLRLDLEDSNSVREFSKAVHERFRHIDVLINNAGLCMDGDKLRKTKDGHESNIAVNYLNTFLLTLSLVDLMGKARKSRIVNTASMSFQMAEFDLNNLNLDNVTTSIHAPYANSKLALIIFTRELAQRLGKNSSINVYALCPGAVLKYNISIDDWSNYWKQLTFFQVEDGCLTTLYCTLSKSLENQSGKMYRLLDVWDVEDRVNYTLGPALWKKTEELVGIKFKKPPGGSFSSTNTNA